MTDRFEFVDLEELTTPKSGNYNLYVDYWWKVTKDFELIFYRHPCNTSKYPSPQCNMNKTIVESITTCPCEFKVVKIPVVYIPAEY